MPGPKYKVSISGTQKHLEQTRDLVYFISSQHGLDKTEADLVEMAVFEACNNALRHGIIRENQSYFDLELTFDENVIKAVITNRGEVFDFNGIEPFNIHQDFIAYKNGSLGIPLIKALMDEVHYKRNPDSTNTLTLIKHLRSKVKKGGK